MYICRYHHPTIKQNSKPKHLTTKAHYQTYKEKTNLFCQFAHLSYVCPIAKKFASHMSVNTKKNLPQFLNLKG